MYVTGLLYTYTFNFILQEDTDVESEDSIHSVVNDVDDVNEQPVTTPTLSPTPNVEVSFMCLVCL